MACCCAVVERDQLVDQLGKNEHSRAALAQGQRQRSESVIQDYGLASRRSADERQIRRFKSPGQAQRFLPVHGVIQNLFPIRRYLLRAVHHCLFRHRAFEDWAEVTCA